MLSFNSAAYLDNLRAGAHPRFETSGVIDWDAWRREFRGALEAALGLPLIRAGAQDLPLAPHEYKPQQFEGYTRQRVEIATEPGIVIPFYLLLPDGATRPLPLVVCPHGHNARGKELYVGDYLDETERAQGEEGERDIALQAVRAGYAAIAPDVRGFWEMARAQEQEAGKISSCADLQRQALMVGRTLIGERVHDMGRLLDYAATRAELDLSRVMMTGNSGGGTVTMFSAALDDRIKLAAPCCSFCTFFDSVVSIHHCPCNVVPGILLLGDMPDIAALIAPRPLLVINGLEDRIFPINAARGAFAQLKSAYQAQGAPDNCEMFVGDGGHSYYKERVWSFTATKLAPTNGKLVAKSLRRP